ncbi:uncharacterized protein A4U43_C01F31500 [Asparagus officinalis]|uniref:Uncharacterized protein n=1 Tax=Asparagus officinalis TaxID=4686 RepID=A0A5P1FU91_ASPOF|nr:uncharacterized protein A4U43_C01F31500 [Asparagus officinalis]
MSVVVIIIDVRYFRMASFLRNLLFYVLIECASGHHVEDLGPTADAEVGDVAVDAEPCEAKLDGVLLAVYGGVTGVEAADVFVFLGCEAGDICIIEGGVDVLSLAEKDAVDWLEAWIGSKLSRSMWTPATRGTITGTAPYDTIRSR